ncbi:MAG: LrgB family protein [Turicibacter sp.]|nr:LrgB family protein [Turicibacter sp.]
MYDLLSTPLAGMLLTVGAYLLGVWLQKKTGSVLANPILIALAICVVAIGLGIMDLSQYQLGGQYLSAMLAPATCAIALSIYRQRRILKENFIPILCGCLASALVSIGVSISLGRLLRLDEVVWRSTIPSSVTTAVAIDLAQATGGLVPLIIICVILTGILGAVLSPFLIKLYGLKDPVEIGVSIGATSHIVGTSKAVELGEVEGAMSGVSIGVSALVTVILLMF